MYVAVNGFASATFLLQFYAIEAIFEKISTLKKKKNGGKWPVLPIDWCYAI